MKLFKKTIDDNIKKDDEFESKYLAREMYLTSEFLNRISNL